MNKFHQVLTKEVKFINFKKKRLERIEKFMGKRRINEEFLY